MRPGEIDWPIMRGAIALFVLALAVSGALVGSALYFSDQMAAGFARQKGQLSSVRSRYQAIDEERRLIETYLPGFAHLQARGIVGDELRLNWIESLRSAGARHKIPSLRYEVDKQTAFKPSFEPTTGAFRLYASRMKLTIGLLHEEDFVRMLRDLDRRAAGLYQIEECSMERNGEELAENPKAQNVRVECVLSWLTIKKPAPEV